MEEKEKTVTPEEFRALVASQEGEFIIHVEIEKGEERIGRKSGGTA